MPNNYLSVLYQNIIQVENKNVGLKVEGHKHNIAPPSQKSGGGTCPPCPPASYASVYIYIYIMCVCMHTQTNRQTDRRVYLPVSQLVWVNFGLRVPGIFMPDLSAHQHRLTNPSWSHCSLSYSPVSVHCGTCASCKRIASARFFWHLVKEYSVYIYIYIKKNCQTGREWNVLHKEGRKEMFYLTTHSTHFIYGYMASYIW